MILALLTIVAFLVMIGGLGLGIIGWLSDEIPRKDATKFITLGIIGLIVLMILTSVVIIEPGEVGVTKVFGTINEEPLQAGIHFVAPFITTVVPFTVKTQEDTQLAYVLTAEGLDVGIDLTVLYRVDPMKVPTIYRTVGENYKGVILDPQIRSVIRDVVATYDAKNIYSADRSNISTKILIGLEKETKSRGIIIENILLRSATLPAKIKEAIESKQQMEQQIQQKQFEVSKEQMEAQRKVAEAQGIADANKIISNSLSSHYLQWYWIQQLSDKDVFYIPTGSDGYPVNLVKDIDTNGVPIK